MTAVFAKMAVIELTPPTTSSQQSGAPPGEKDRQAEFRLTIAILDDEINVLNGETPLGVFKRMQTGHMILQDSLPCSLN